MKAVFFAIAAISTVAMAGDAYAPGTKPGDDKQEPHISVTMYDSPHSAGESTWMVHQTVSYSVGPGYTKMIMAPAASSTSSAAAPSGTWAASGKPAEGPAGWSSSAAPAAPTDVKQYTGGAGQAVAGAGAIAMAGLAYFL